VLVGQNGVMATPAMSALIRRRKLYGGLIMSASHNPAGPKEDWGIKFNYKSGEPAPEKITNAIFDFTKNIKELKQARACSHHSSAADHFLLQFCIARRGVPLYLAMCFDLPWRTLETHTSKLQEQHTI
jgi:Phosphoglucomutase/phosphomannomutase, alpha/beta/alpha domain I